MTMPNANDFKGVPVVKYAIYGIAGLIGLCALLGATYVIDPGRAGVVTRFGQIVTTAPAGLHFKFPFIDDVMEIPTSLQTLQVNTVSVSRDIQEVQTKVNVQYSIPITEIDSMYTNYRGDRDALNQAIVGPGVETILKTVSARFTAEELISKREQVSTELKDRLSSHLKKNAGVIVAKVDITEFSFSKTFTDSIEAKVVAEQGVLTEQQLLARKQVEAQRVVAEAKAEAEATKMRADAEAYAIQKQNQYATEMNVRMREAEAKIKTAEALDKWRPTVIGATPLVQTPTE